MKQKYYVPVPEELLTIEEIVACVTRDIVAIESMSAALGSPTQEYAGPFSSFPDGVRMQFRECFIDKIP
jgi:hypothetical protein